MFANSSTNSESLHQQNVKLMHLIDCLSKQSLKIDEVKLMLSYVDNFILNNKTIIEQLLPSQGCVLSSKMNAVCVPVFTLAKYRYHLATMQQIKREIEQQFSDIIPTPADSNFHLKYDSVKC